MTNSKNNNNKIVKDNNKIVKDSNSKIVKDSNLNSSNKINSRRYCWIRMYITRSTKYCTR